MFPHIAPLLGPLASSRSKALPNYFTGAWVDAISVASMPTTSIGWSNYTFRNYIGRNRLPAHATQVRFTFKASPTVGLNIQKVFAGPSTKNTFLTTPNQVFFSGSPGVLIPANTSVVSDPVDITYLGNSDICVSGYIPTGSSPNDSLTYGAAIAFCGGGFVLNDLANSTAAFASVNANRYAIERVEVFTGNDWIELEKHYDQFLSEGWTGYTLRTRFDAGLINPTHTHIRVGFLGSVSKAYIGNAVATAASIDYLSTPTQILFGGAVATPGAVVTDSITFYSDLIDTSLLDFTQPIVIAYRAAGSFIGRKSTTVAGITSKYRNGDFVADMVAASFVSYNYAGPVVVDGTLPPSIPNPPPPPDPLPDVADGNIILEDLDELAVSSFILDEDGFLIITE